MKFHSFLATRACAVAIGILVSASALGQLRVGEWNVSNYSSGRVSEFQTAIYNSFSGRSFAPDILIGQEFLSSAGVTNFLNILNTASGSPGDWAAAPFINGPDTDNAFFYRTSRVTFLGVTTVSTGGVAPNHPRNVERYDVRLIGYDAAEATLACYSSHMKSGTTSDDQARRLVEADAIRTDAENLTAGWNFVLGADTNTQSSTQAAYVELTGSQAGNNGGRFRDPIVTPGSWNNNSAYRFVHTQDPSGAGGMDDRHDQILISNTLRDSDGFDYIGDYTTAYSTSTWNDTNHSYRSWGNDGTSFNTTLTVSGNQMVGATIAQALVDSTSQGHLPVFLDLRVPAEIDSETVLDFGQVTQGALAQLTLNVSNAGDEALWTAAGIDDLDYSLLASAGFTAPGGVFVDSAGGGANAHVIEMDTSTVGMMNGTLNIISNAPDDPNRLVTLIGEVVDPNEPNDCIGDLDGDTFVDLTDLGILLIDFGCTGAGCVGDINGDEITDLTDLGMLLLNFGTSCP